MIVLISFGVYYIAPLAINYLVHHLYFPKHSLIICTTLFMHVTTSFLFVFLDGYENICFVEDLPRED